MAAHTKRRHPDTEQYWEAQPCPLSPTKRDHKYPRHQSSGERKQSQEDPELHRRPRTTLPEPWAEQDWEGAPCCAGECPALKRRPFPLSLPLDQPSKPLSSPQPPKEREDKEDMPPCTPCGSNWVLDEFLLEPPPATLRYHLVLEAAKELSAVEQRQQEVPKEAPASPPPSPPPAPKEALRDHEDMTTQTSGGSAHIPLEGREELTLRVEDLQGQRQSYSTCPRGLPPHAPGPPSDQPQPQP